MIDKIQGKREREKRTVALMIRLYCRKKHGTKKIFVPNAKHFRSMRCSAVINAPLWKPRPFALTAVCIVTSRKCVKKIREVMRFSGPRMILHHPVMAVRHVIESKKEKKRLEKENEN